MRCHDAPPLRIGDAGLSKSSCFMQGDILTRSLEEERCQEHTAQKGSRAAVFSRPQARQALPPWLPGAAAPQLAAIAEGYEPGQPETQGEQIFRGVCRPNCFGFCHLNVHVRDGKVSKDVASGIQRELLYAHLPARPISRPAHLRPAAFEIPNATRRRNRAWRRGVGAH